MSGDYIQLPPDGTIITLPVSIADGGTGATTAAGARTNLSAAKSGANSDITSLSGLTTPLSLAQGGTGATTAAGARTSLGLGTAAVQDIGTSGATVPLLSTANTWSLNQTAPSWSATATSSGSLNIIQGGATTSGYLEWRLAAGTRLGYLGLQTSSVTLTLENGSPFVVSGGNTFLTGSNVVLSANAVVANISGVANGGGVQILADALTGNRYLRLGGYDNGLTFYPTIYLENPANSSGCNVGFGEPTAATRIHASTSDSSTNTVTDILKINHSSSGTPAASFGTGILFAGASTTTNNRDMARVQSIWTTATDASRASSLQFQTLTGAGSLTTQMTILGTGDVGIGTTSPVAALNIVRGDNAELLRLSATSLPVSYYLSIQGVSVGSSDYKFQVTNAGVTKDVLYFQSNTGNIGLGSTTFPSGGGAPVVVLPQGSGNPSGIASNTAGFFAKDVAGTCELFGFDEAGNVTQLTAHAFDGPAWLYDADDPLPRVLKEQNIYLGITRWTNLSRQSRLFERILSGEDLSKLSKYQKSFVYVEVSEEKESWSKNQDDHLKKTAASPDVKFGTYIKKPIPPWLAERGGS